MGKIVFWIVVVFLVLFGLRMYNVAKARKGRAKQSKTGAAAQSMVQCVQCGVFLPKPEARESTTGYRCQDPACVARH